MLCNMCIKQDICPYKEGTETILKYLIQTQPHLEYDCKHRHAGTTDEIQRLRENEDTEQKPEATTCKIDEAIACTDTTKCLNCPINNFGYPKRGD